MSDGHRGGVLRLYGIFASARGYSRGTMNETIEREDRKAVMRLTSGEADTVKVTVRLDDDTYEDRELAVHPLAKLIPLITPGDLDRLIDDVRDNGVNEPLIMFEGQVLDGRNRLAVASVLGASVQLAEFDGDTEAARALVWSANAARRHLTVPQIALAAERFGFVAAAKAEAGPVVPDADGLRPPVAPWAKIAARKIGAITAPTLERFQDARVSEAPDTAARVDSGEIRRVDVAVKEAVAERSVREGRVIAIPPVVPRTPFDRLGCARGDVMAAERAVMLGERGGMTAEQFAVRAREIQAALIRIQQIYRYGRAD